MYNQAFRRFRWSSRRKMQSSKEEKQRWRSKLLSWNRPIRKICLALTGLAVVLSFFQTWGFFSFYKPRCLVYKAQKDCTDINVTLMATLYHTICSGLRDEYTCPWEGRTQQSHSLKSGLQAMDSNTEFHCAHAQKREGVLERTTNTLSYLSRQMLLCCRS